MKKVFIALLACAAAALLVFLAYRRQPRTDIPEATVRSDGVHAAGIPHETPNDSQRENAGPPSASVLSLLKSKLRAGSAGLSIPDITNNLLLPYTDMKDEIPRDVENIISMSKGLPAYLSEEEKELRRQTFDALGNLPEELRYWSNISPEYIAMTNSVLRPQEVSIIIDLYRNDWDNLMAVADRLVCGDNAYRDIHAARRIFEYVWKNCPPDARLEDEYWKYTGLQFLADTYLQSGVGDNLEKGVELYNTLDTVFTYDYDPASPKSDIRAKSPYFWPGIIARAYVHTLRGNPEGVEETYRRYDKVFEDYDPEENPLLKASIVQKVELSCAIAHYHSGDIGPNELARIFRQAAHKFGELADNPATNPMAKQKNRIDKEQALNVVRYFEKLN